MKTKNLWLLFYLLLVSVAGFTQKISNQKVNVNYLNYPFIPVEGKKTYKINIYPGNLEIEQKDIKEKRGLIAKLQNAGPNDIYFATEYQLTADNPDAHIEVAYGEFQIISENMQDHEIPCNRGKKITKESITNCPAFYYDVEFSLPVYITITDGTGKVLMAEKMPMEGITHFGYDESKISGYLNTNELKQDYASKGQQVVLQNAFEAKLEEAEDIIQQAFGFYYDEHRLTIISGKGKSYDYSQLDKAQEEAIAAFETFEKDPSGGQFKEAIQNPIKVWEKELQAMDRFDKKAKINRKIGAELNQNLALAYLFSRDFVNASKYIQETHDLLTSGSSRRLDKIEEAEIYQNLIDRRRKNQFGADLNKNVDVSALVKSESLMSPARNKKKKLLYPVLVAGNQYYSALAQNYEAYEKERQAHQEKETEVYENSMAAATEDATENQYESKVTQTTTQGYMLILNSFIDPKMEELHTDICALKHLNQITANGMGIITIPAQINNLRDLKILSLNNNKITTLPDEVCELSNLKKLNLNNNALTALPHDIGNLASLKKLNLKGNKIPAAEQARIENALPDCKVKF